MEGDRERVTLQLAADGVDVVGQVDLAGVKTRCAGVTAAGCPVVSAGFGCVRWLGQMVMVRASPRGSCPGCCVFTARARTCAGLLT